MQTRLSVLWSKRSYSIYRLGVVVVVAAIGISLGLQGWNSRTVVFDHINFIEGADGLLSRGILPDRGDVSSYAAFATPGTSWLMVPGMLLFSDPRLYEVIASAGLYIGTLLGLFLIAEISFGFRCACLSVLLYGLSRNGLFYAASLWSIGHPFFYVWTAYLCFLWVRGNDSKYLAAALFVWSFGMYVDMVLAPALFIFPVMWLIYRPTLRARPVVMAGAIAFAIWYPYIRFQADRDFVDIQSLVLRQPILPEDYRDSWCMPALVLQTLDASGSGESKLAFLQTGGMADEASLPRTRLERMKEMAGHRAVIFTEALTFNFDQMAGTRWAAAPLSLLAVLTLAFIALQMLPAHVAMPEVRELSKWIQGLAWISFFFALLINEAFVARFLSMDGILEGSTIWSIRALQTVSVFVALALLGFKREIAESVRQLLQREQDVKSPTLLCNRVLFALVLLVPWLSLLMVVEIGRPERYWWLWPLQTVAIVAAVTYLPERSGWHRSVAWIGQIVLASILLSHSWLASPVESWARSGWSGPTANDIQAVDYVANEVRSQGRSQAAIGYDVYFYAFMPTYNAVDPRYKVGAHLDLFLKHKHGISNSNQCAEGVSAGDEYRIVQAPPAAQTGAADPFDNQFEEYFDVPLDPSFRMVGRFGDYQVFRRTEVAEN